MRLSTISLLLVASVASAQGQPVADLAVELQAESRAAANSIAPTTVVITNHGPAATDPVVTFTASPLLSQVGPVGLIFGRCNQLRTDTFRCSLDSLNPGKTVRIRVEFRVGPLSEIIMARVDVTGSAPDPDLSNNVDSQSIEVSTDPDLSLHFFTASQLRVEPGSEVRQRLDLNNLSVDVAREVLLVIDLPEGSEFVSLRTQGTTCQGPPGDVVCGASPVQWDCAALGTQILCRAAEIPTHTFENFMLVSRIAPMHPGGKATTSARVTSAGEFTEADNFATADAFVYHHLEVATTEDGGPGSLRAVIEEANRICNPELLCKIDFRLHGPPSEDGTFTIRPLSPLPPVTATDVLIDATTQTARTGDSNPHGPEVVLNGGHLAAGSGLVLSSACEVGVRGLVINGFPENGLIVSKPEECANYPRVVEQNYIGTDATGTHAVPNGLRGIVIDSSPRICHVATIASNLISGNSRSGIFLNQPCSITVGNNRIGTTASGDAPLSNGASGIYLQLPTYYGADIHDNVIAFNAEFGISTNGQFGYVGFRHNRIHSNGLLGVDLGLDGVNEGDARYVQLLSARYDAPRGKTVVEGILDSPPGLYALGRFVLEFFSSSTPDPSGFGEGETLLGEIVSTFTYPVREFTFEYDGDLTGQFITATASSYEIGLKPGSPAAASRPWQGYPYRTTEFSRAIPVQ